MTKISKNDQSQHNELSHNALSNKNIFVLKLCLIIDLDDELQGKY